MESPLTTLIALNTVRSHSVPPPVAAWLNKPCSVMAAVASNETVAVLVKMLALGCVAVPVARVLSGFSAVVDSVTSAVSEVASAVVPVPQP